MRREQYLQYYKETESKADILINQSNDKFQDQNEYYIEEKIKIRSSFMLIWDKER